MQNQNQKENTAKLPEAKKAKNLFAGLFQKKKMENPLKSVLNNQTVVLPTEKTEEIKPKGSSLIDQKGTQSKKSFLSFWHKKEKLTAIKNAENSPEISLTKTTTDQTEKNIEKIPNKTEKIESKPVSAKSLIAGLFQKNIGKKPEIKSEKNLFVDLFPQEAGKNKDDTLIETIVEQSEQKTSILGQKLHGKQIPTPLPNNPVETKSDLLFFAYCAIAGALFIPLSIYLFFYFHTTSQSSILDTLGIKNTGMLYVEQSVKKNSLEEEIKKIQADIVKLETTSQQALMEKTIAQIKNSSNDWLLVMQNINEVTNQGVRYNDLLKRVNYTSYNFDHKENKINLTAEIVDPTKQVFNLATSLIDAVNDSSYFTGMENRNFSKTMDDDGAKMSLTLNFTYLPESQRENLTTVLEK